MERKEEKKGKKRKTLKHNKHALRAQAESRGEKVTAFH